MTMRYQGLNSWPHSMCVGMVITCILSSGMLNPQRVVSLHYRILVIKEAPYVNRLDVSGRSSSIELGLRYSRAS